MESLKRNLDINTLRLLHLLIIVGWFLPYILDVPQTFTPFIVTAIILTIDVIMSEGYSLYAKMLFHVFWTNLVGIVFSTLEYVNSSRELLEKQGIDYRMAFMFSGIWTVIFVVMLIIAIIIGFVALYIKNQNAKVR